MKAKFVPNQHGAWAMLLVPFLFGVAAAKPVWLHVPLFFAWLLAYLLSFALLQRLRTKNRAYHLPLAIYAGLLVPLAVWLLAALPKLVFWLLLYLPLLLINGFYARQNRERELLNDLIAVLQFSLMVWIAFQVGEGEDWAKAAAYFALSVLYFTGTVFYVKTVIRERNNPVYYRLSVGYHALLFYVAAFFYPPGLLPVTAALLVRAAWIPRTKLKVKSIGILEIIFAVLIACSALAAIS